MKDFKFLKEPLYKRIFDIVVEIGDNVIDNNDEYMDKVYFRDEAKIKFLHMDTDLQEENYIMVIECVLNDELATKLLTFQCAMDDTEWNYLGDYIM